MTFRSGDEVASPAKIIGIAAKRIPIPMGNRAVSFCPCQRTCQTGVIENANVFGYSEKSRGFEDYLPYHEFSLTPYFACFRGGVR